jgi:hypothetical protein
MKKVFIINTYYGHFLNDFYNDNPLLKKEKYQKQKQEILKKNLVLPIFILLILKS